MRASAARGMTRFRAADTRTTFNYQPRPRTMGGTCNGSRPNGECICGHVDWLPRESGLSYRIHTKFRIYAAWLSLSEFVDEGGQGKPADAWPAASFSAEARAAL